MAQMMRAILLASATAASFFGLRASNPKSHGAARPRLACWITAVAPSTSNRRRLSSPSRLILPSRCLPPVEFSRGVITPQSAAPSESPSDQAPPLSRGQAFEGEADAADRPDAGDRGQALAGLVAPMPGHQQHLERLQLGLHSVELCRQHTDHLARQSRHARVIRQTLQQLDDLLWPPCSSQGQAFGDRNAKLRSMAADRVDQHRALLDQ